MRMVKMPIVKIVLMAVVLHGHMSAVWTMDVRVRFVNIVIAAHLSSPSLGLTEPVVG
jgi:hypothetical protein